MKIFKTPDVRKIDSYTIDHEPIASIDLMERASLKFSDWFARNYDISRKVLVFAGPGNNGGDGLAVARILHQRNFRLEVYMPESGNKLSDDCRYNLERLKKETSVSVKILEKPSDFPVTDKSDLLIDALFGSGLNRPPEGLAARLILHLNNSGSEIIALDIPSGLPGEGLLPENGIAVKARHTITFQFPFLSFFFPENAEFTGKWKAVSIGLHPGIIRELPSEYTLSDPELVRSVYRKKSPFSHKGSNGHALLVSGCYGMMGAAVLATRACIRSGAGLVTAHIPGYGYNIMQTSVPEALISIDQSDILFTEVESLSKFDAIGIGPGLNCKTNTGKGVLKLVREAKVPMVIDADALNILSANPQVLAELQPGTILTPHPGEFDRLAGTSANSFERHIKQLELSAKYGLIIVLKGKYTFISMPEGHTFINMTGNQGLATGGSGDVLTGIILSLLAQSYPPKEAAVMGTYIHGLAADLALEFQSHESLIPSDVIQYLGRAFKSISTD